MASGVHGEALLERRVCQEGSHFTSSPPTDSRPTTCQILAMYECSKISKEKVRSPELLVWRVQKLGERLQNTLSLSFGFTLPLRELAFYSK